MVRAGSFPTIGWSLRVPRPGLGVLAGLLAALSSILQLILHPVLGLADNGDYKRVLTGLHLAAVVPAGQSSSFRYIWLDYQPGGPPQQNGYASSELALAHVIHRGNDFLGLGPGMDLRAMGVAQSILLGVAVWLIVRALPGPRALRVVTAALLVLVLTDTRFVVYFDSFFTEPASMLALLFLVAAVLHTWRKPTSTPVDLILIALPAAALLLSKSQNAPLVIVVVVLLVARRCDWRRLSGRIGGRVLPALVALGLLALAGNYLRAQPEGLTQDNTYNAVFVELLGHTSNPAADLRALGLDPGLARYAKRPIYARGNATQDPRFNGFFTKVGHRKLAEFYLEHPAAAAALAHRGATASMELKPRGVSPPLGNQTKSSGARPYSSSCKLCVYSTISWRLRGGSAILVPALWLAALALAVALAASALRGRPVRRLQERGFAALAAVLAMLLASAVLSMAIALLGEGEYEIVKHLYLTSVSNALLVVLVVHAIGLLLVARRERKRPIVSSDAEEPDGRLVVPADAAERDQAATA